VNDVNQTQREMETCGIVWFRNDLRIADHEPLIKANLKHDRIIPCFIWDPKIYPQQSENTFRAGFLNDTLQWLKSELRKHGSDLLVAFGNTAEELIKISRRYHVTEIYAHEEYAPYERQIEAEVNALAFRNKIEVHFYQGNALVPKTELPFTITHLPDVFTKFRSRVESSSQFAKPLQEKAIKPLPAIPTNELHYTLPGKMASSTLFHPGTESALQRLKYYAFEKHLLPTYFETRNGLLHFDDSTKLSPWLAVGSITPAMILSEVEQYEKQFGANKSTYWVKFELLWRDYFRLVVKKFGAQLFRYGGIRNRSAKPIMRDENRINAWIHGTTGFPIIDAIMRELKETGYTSNRGRQLAASFFVHDLQQDWRIGARYFEQQLIDYDVHSNWGNWAYIAGVGNDPRPERYFNIPAQSERYDPHVDFIKAYCPELKNVPAKNLHHFHEYSESFVNSFGIQLGEHYPSPIVQLSMHALKH
jgi:deoxyribodipyrimidine photo-lyase